LFLAIDIGNTSTNFGIFNGDALLNTFSFPTKEIIEQSLSASQLQEKVVLLSQGEGAFISVVPKANEPLVALLTQLDRSVVKLDYTNLPMPIAYKRPNEVGTDRLVGSLAAYELWGKQAKRAVVVIDLGTATTYDCISSAGKYLGGAISLGIESSAEYLSSRAAQLPKIPLEFPEQVLGQSTIEAMQSGILYGALASMEGLIERLTKEVFPDEDPIIVATGGLSRLFKGRTTLLDHIEPNLVLLGINIAFRKIAAQEKAA